MLRNGPLAAQLQNPGGATVKIRVYAKALRAHQWAKNTLVFVAALASGKLMQLHSLSALGLVFVAFCCVASAGYLINDLLDLESDRAHPTKRNRPLASGAMPVYQGVALAAVLMVGGLAAAAYVSQVVGVILLLYLVLTLTYSYVLKRIVLIDAITLASLYTVRVLAGAAAIRVVPSMWLLAFSTFIFFSLALVKRCTELIVMAESQRAKTRGRDYRVSDAPYLQSMGIASGYLAVLVIALYLDSPNATSLYHRPMVLWAMCPLFLFWVSHLWIKTGRHEMHDDPLVFSIKDRTSWIFFLSIAVVWAIAHF
jgi:4-hydroxybenzoate polyprenyltransferase